jgi:hypothetical protein
MVVGDAMLVNAVVVDASGGGAPAPAASEFSVSAHVDGRRTLRHPPHSVLVLVIELSVFQRIHALPVLVIE